jgi:hypothetical protein
MGKPLAFGLITVLAFIFSPAARAQRGGSVGGGAHAAAPARFSSASRSGHVFTNVRLNANTSPAGRRSGFSSGSRVLFYGPNSSLSRNTLPAFGGLGFDCENLACSSGSNLGVEALINPSTAANLALAARFHRLGNLTGAYLLTGYGGGYPIAYDEPEADNQDQEPAPTQQQPQIIVIQQPAPPAKAEADLAPAAEAPLPDVGDFTLLLKNGGEISAVAFTRRNDQLVYITREGNRRTVRLADIDVAATTKLNEDRGTPLKLSI